MQSSPTQSHLFKSAVCDAVGLSRFVLMTDALTRANASISACGWRFAVVYGRIIDMFSFA